MDIEEPIHSRGSRIMSLSAFFKNWKRIAGVAVVVSILVLLTRSLTNGWTIPDLIGNTGWVRVSAVLAMSIVLCTAFEGARSMGVATTRKAAAIFGLFTGLFGLVGGGIDAILEGEALGQSVFRGVLLTVIAAAAAWTIFVLGEHSDTSRRAIGNSPR